MAVTDAGARFDFGRVTSRTFSLIGRNFVPFAVLAALLAGVPYVVMLILIPALGGSEPGAVGLGAILSVIVLTLAGFVLQAALTRASVDDLSGKGVSIGAALSTGVAMMLPLFGLGIIMGLGIGVGMLLLIVPGIFLALMWIVASPVLVVERLGIFPSLQRSGKLTENHRWAILGLIVLYVIIVIIIQIVIGLMIPGAAATMSGLSQEGPTILTLVFLFLMQTVNSMIGTVGIAAIYFELRQIKEGVDVTELAQVFA
jgi:hypothetical protein